MRVILGMFMTESATENQGSVFQTPCRYGWQCPAHPSLTLSMYGVIEIASSRRGFPYPELTYQFTRINFRK